MTSKFPSQQWEQKAQIYISTWFCFSQNPLISRTGNFHFSKMYHKSFCKKTKKTSTLLGMVCVFQTHWHISWKREGLFSTDSFEIIHITEPRKIRQGMGLRNGGGDIDYHQPIHFTKQKTEDHWSQLTHPSSHSSSWTTWVRFSLLV